MRQRLPLPKGIPKTLRLDSYERDVIALGDGRLAFWYKRGSQRIVVKRWTIVDLRSAFNDVATGIINAETVALDITAEDRRMYISARDELHPRKVDAVARDAAEAFKIAGAEVSLRELALFYMKRNPLKLTAPATAKIVTDLLAWLGDKQRSAKYLAGLRRDLTRFAAACPDLGGATPDSLLEYLRGLRDHRDQPVGARRRNNVRDAIVRLFSYARDERAWLPEDRKTAADRIHRLDTTSDILTYTPAEILLLLEHVSYRWRPWMAIGAFAGLRTSEIFRLQWSAVKFEGKCIAVSRRVAKKVRISRKVPMSDNLIAWLEPWKDAVGPLYQAKTWSAIESAHRRELLRLKKATGLTWDNNALRHSFGSYRLAIIKDEARVALEMGNSVAKVRENYHDPKSEQEAKLYFDVMPPDTNREKVIPLPLEFR